MKATLTFTNRNQAENFTIAWGRFSKTGHHIGGGFKNVKVTVFDIDNESKKFVDDYVLELNKQFNESLK